MSSDDGQMRRISRRARAGLLAAAVAFAGATGASAGVVVYATGPSAGNFPVGKKVASADRILLRAGDRIRILDGTSTRDLRGPGTYTLDQRPGGGRQGTFAALVEPRSAGRVRTGAVRDGPTTDRPTNIWFVDVVHPGTVCLVSTQRITLWRADATGDAAYSLTASAGATATVEFPEGQPVAAWDTVALPVSDAAVFKLAGPDGRELGEFRFRLIAEPASEPEALAEQLIANGCIQQLETLSAALAADE
jgi:hypothetical protein